jgi:hypothetical protein
VQRIQPAWQCKPSEPAEQLVLLALELRVQLDSRAQLGQAVGLPEQLEPQAKEQRAQQDYRVLTELQVLQESLELMAQLVLQEPLVDKVAQEPLG